MYNSVLCYDELLKMSGIQGRPPSQPYSYVPTGAYILA